MENIALTSDQKQGTGKKFTNLAKEKVGDRSMVLLLSVPPAMGYYPKTGSVKQKGSFILNRAEWK